MDIYYIDGQFIPADQAVIPVNDLAVLRGYGVFDVIRTFQGRPFLLGDHLHRLAQSAEQIGLSMPWSTETLSGLVSKTLAQNHHAESNIRVVVTGGASADFMTPNGPPRLLILVSQAPVHPPHWYSDGVAVITTITERFKPGIKSINYVPAAMALQAARDVGAVEALYVDRYDQVLEGTTSNVFAVSNGVLITPDTGILTGITRQVIIDIATDRFQTELRSLSVAELLGADEVFITGTNKGVVPVISVDGTAIGEGTPGTTTRAIMAAMMDRTGIGVSD